MGSLSASHWLIVLIVVLLVMGPKKLPGLGKSIGEGIRGLKEGLSGKEPSNPSEKSSDEKPAEKALKSSDDDAPGA